MKSMNLFLMSACLGLAATTSFAADDMMKKDGMAKDGMMKPMTMDDCKGHMAMAKKDGTAKRDEMMMKKDAMCADMMKKDGMAKDGMMKKDDSMMKKDEPMKK